MCVCVCVCICVCVLVCVIVRVCVLMCVCVCVCLCTFVYICNIYLDTYFITKFPIKSECKKIKRYYEEINKCKVFVIVDSNCNMNKCKECI